MTEAESAFWSFAKGSGLGEKCRRQYINHQKFRQQLLSNQPFGHLPKYG